MDPFTIGIITLFAATIIFFLIFGGFIYYWHLTRVTYIVVPVIWTFEFFVMGFLVVAIVSIILNYLPVLASAIGS